MSDFISRRSFTTLSASVVLGAASDSALGAENKTKTGGTEGAGSPSEAPFERDYPQPTFKPSWKKQQINRQLVQDFVIYAHSDLAMVKRLLAKELALLNATMDWGAGDW